MLMLILILVFLFMVHEYAYFYEYIWKSVYCIKLMLTTITECVVLEIVYFVICLILCFLGFSVIILLVTILQLNQVLVSLLHVSFSRDSGEHSNSDVCPPNCLRMPVSKHV